MSIYQPRALHINLCTNLSTPVRLHPLEMNNYLYIYIYIEREREKEGVKERVRERGKERYKPIYLPISVQIYLSLQATQTLFKKRYIYIYIYICVCVCVSNTQWRTQQRGSSGVACQRGRADPFYSELCPKLGISIYEAMWKERQRTPTFSLFRWYPWGDKFKRVWSTHQDGREVRLCLYTLSTPFFWHHWPVL